ncbi:DUF881 domain-containing protein [Calidifontibacter terrae]
MSHPTEDEPTEPTAPTEPNEPAATDPTSTEPPAKPTRGPWSRLGRMGRPRLTKANALATVLALLLGFAMVTQVRANRAGGLESMSQEDLINLLDNVNQQGTRLTTDITTLTGQRDQLKSGGGDAAAVAAARERLTALQILAGTAPAQGPGITFTINDPSGALASNNVLDAVEELRDAGAEAIQINDVRIIAASWFGLAQDGKLIADGKTLEQPYVITAIGDPHTMSTALAIPGGVVETLRQSGIQTQVVSKQAVSVTALRGAVAPRYAQAEPSGK